MRPKRSRPPSVKPEINRQQPVGKPEKNWQQGRERVTFFMFGGSMRSGLVQPKNLQRVKTILTNSQRVFALESHRLPETAMQDLEAICRGAENFPLEITAKKIREYFLHSGIDLLEWHEPERRH